MIYDVVHDGIRVDSVKLAEKVCRRHEELMGAQVGWRRLWQEIAEYVQPRKAFIDHLSLTPSTGFEARLFDNTAIFGNLVLANGMASWMTPAESRWFSFDPPAQLAGSDKVKQWLDRVTSITENVLKTESNFYSEVHEGYLDRGAFGTQCLYVADGMAGPLQFCNYTVGSYCIAENSEKIIDTVSREIEMSVRQAAQEFGEENLSEKLRKELGEKPDNKHWFIHMVCPREDGERQFGKIDGPNMPIASIYLEKSGKKVNRISGYEEMPYMVTRFLRWGHDVYGYSPGWMALPEIRQTNFLQKQMDALAEKLAFPPLLVPNDQEGEVDIRAGGITYFNPAQGSNGFPREWGQANRYDVGKDRVEMRQEAIRQAFHVDLFRMFANLEKQMTAREVAERASEKLIQFSPTFARMTTELYNPLLRRVFGILLRRGQYPPPPPEMVVPVSATHGFIPPPEITYTSRIALAIKQLQNLGFIRTIEMLAPMLEIRPDILDNLNLDRITRDLARNDGLPADWLHEEEDVDMMRQTRAAQQQQMQQMQMAGGMADAAAKVGSIKEDSLIGKVLEQQAPAMGA